MQFLQFSQVVKLKISTCPFSAIPHPVCMQYSYTLGVSQQGLRLDQEDGSFVSAGVLYKKFLQVLAYQEISSNNQESIGILRHKYIKSIMKILAAEIEVKNYRKKRTKKLKPKTFSGCFTNAPPVEPVPTKHVLLIWQERKHHVAQGGMGWHRVAQGGIGWHGVAHAPSAPPLHRLTRL